MRIGLAVPVLVDGDAVGHDVLGMAERLNARGHDVLLYAWRSATRWPVRTPEQLPQDLTSPEDVLIYHHSIGCDWGVKAIERLACRKAVKYHNVTPPQFFRGLNADVAAGCEQGLKELPRLVRSGAHLWADSGFNALDLNQYSPKRPVAELPPFHHADELLRVEPDFQAVAGLDDWATTLLVIGRVVPNKNLALAVKTLAAMSPRPEAPVRLVIVGDRVIPGHAAEIDALIRETGQEANVLVTGKVTTAQLKALYLTADVLLVTSLHEGFCVPLVEAMGLRLPIVAVPNAAVPHTGGPAGHYVDADPVALANQIQTVMTNRDVRESNLNAGWSRYAEQFTTAAIARRFDRVFDELIAS